MLVSVKPEQVAKKNYFGYDASWNSYSGMQQNAHDLLMETRSHLGINLPSYGVPLFEWITNPFTAYRIY